MNASKSIAFDMLCESFIPVISDWDHIIKGNVFIGRATNVSTYGETREAVRQILRKPDIITATHNSYAYSFTDIHGKQHQGYDDDGEFGAGSKLLKLLKDNKHDNVLVVVSRYAGDKLGPQRFNHLTTTGNAAVTSL
ncbi:hypothetical protein KUTeg_005778 [Tegillarca granosa]|uniref:Impact N-terminal domain-containing protein n=1 Tax=Tegillarca granosa TaxID=220873 RepID=A0ABQ9FHA6_TEGGR|nr:hypothetical protein KUTeg_005778 [Tegillarca granosa]